MKSLKIIWTILWLFIGYGLFLPVLDLTFGSSIYIYIAFWFLGMAGINYLLKKSKTGYLLAFVAIFSITIIIEIGSSGIFNSSKYRNLIGEIKKDEFTANVAPIDPKKMILVDEPMAQRLGDKVLGDDPGLGSKCKLGSFHMQTVGDELYWIAPLVHSGFFKWFGNDYTEGYVVVNATNEKDVRLIKEVNNKPIKIKYQPNAYFAQDLERHIYMSGKMFDGLAQATFEVDNDWNPYWTVVTYDTKIGFGGDDATGILVINPESGDIHTYGIDNAPAWINRLQPVTFVNQQLVDWGDLIHGWFNPSGKDKLKVIDDYSIVLGSDHQLYYYHGLQSTGSNDGTVGFVMTDCRTKKSIWIHQSGATEEAARGSAEGAVQAERLKGSEGITYNIGGYPTYEFLLKAEDGLMKKIALVSVRNYEDVGIGVDRKSAIRDYLMKVGRNRGNLISGPSDLNIIDTITTIKRINSEIISGNTIYYFTIKSRDNQFIGNNLVSTEFALSQPGDEVRLQYIDGDGEISVLLFDNLNIASLSMTQQKNKNQNDSLLIKTVKKEQEKNFDQTWDKLSPEEKQKLLKN